MVQARITSKGQITVPKAVRDHLGVREGDVLAFQFAGDQVLIVPVRRRSLLDFRGRFTVAEALDHDQERALARAARASRLLGDAERQDG